MVGYIQSKFEAHNYHVDYFGKKNDDKENVFNQDNIEEVIRKSSQYTAIIIMTHGCLDNYGHSWVATRDAPSGDMNELVYREPVENRKYRMIPVEESLREVSSNCIVYIGACNGVPNGGFEKFQNAFPHNTKACAIGWEGKNCIAQAHAALFFHYLLYYGFDVVEALKGLPDKDPKYEKVSKMHFSNYGGSITLTGNEELRPQYSKTVRAELEANHRYVYYENDYHNGHQELKVTGNWFSKNNQIGYRICMRNALTGYVALRKFVVAYNSDILDKKINITWDDLSNVNDGAYEVYMEVRENDGWNRVRLSAPASIIVSSKFNTLYALPELPEDRISPKILGNNEQIIDEITLSTGMSNTFKIDGCKSHTFRTVSLDPNIATVSVIGNDLTIKGVSEGFTFIGVEDEQNKEIAIAEVMVNGAGNTPDDNSVITFEDPNVKAICVANWDTNGDGELSKVEAAAVNDLGDVFHYNNTITSFNELQYFTGLTSIGKKTFYYCGNLTSIMLPNSVTSIGESAFWQCNKLASIVIPNSVTSIGSGAFGWCFGLTSIVIPDSVTTIGNDAFCECEYLTSIVIGKSLTSMGESPFFKCDALSYVEFHCDKIGKWFGETSTNIQSVVIGDEVTSIDDYAFYSIETLTNVTIGNSVTSIGDGTFAHCSGITSITIGESLESIGKQTFMNCSSLSSIIIPNSVTSIGKSAFSSCKSLSSVTIGNSVKSIGDNAFQSCSSLSSISIPNSVSSIGEYAFKDCSGLSSIIIPNSVSSIGKYAFYGCSGLTSITIGSAVTVIGDHAFRGCTRVNKVISYIAEPFDIHYYSFADVPSSAVLYVPAGSKSKYETKKGWMKFANNIVEM